MEPTSNEVVQLPRRPTETAREHVVILHEKLAKRKSDRYILNLALAYHHLGYKVTVITTQYNKGESLEDLEYSEKIDVKFSAWWIPRTIFGMLRGCMSNLKAAWMAFRISFNPPKRKPALVVLDINLIALGILHLFTSYKLFYVALLEPLREDPELCEHSLYYPSLLEAKWIKLADTIIAESDGFAEIFKQSFPALVQEPVVLYPSVDIGLWNKPAIRIQRIIPDLLENTTVFLTVGKFKRSANFKLALDAFEILLQLIDDRDATKRFQLVIAGNCKTLDEKLYYNQLVAATKDRMCASQVTILKQLPTVHEKTLIMESAVMIHPSRSDVHGDFILKSMSLGKPIVAVGKSIASKLLQNKISGIITESDPNAIAQVLRKLMSSSHLLPFMGQIANESFQKNFSFNNFCERLRILSGKYSTESINRSRKTI
ncbi:uncharacterized protein LOC143198217 [Rhynchophorus ferrugineus]|uniref:uncharacterized protein LOC143198217 n=1 Tax=Rhynchophorus ferrugineus TaxID=354439 RepID=UPI003FCC62F3